MRGVPVIAALSIVASSACSLEPFVPYDAGESAEGDGASLDRNAPETGSLDADLTELEAGAADAGIASGDGEIRDSILLDAESDGATESEDAAAPDAPAAGNGRIAVEMVGSGRDFASVRSGAGGLSCPGACWIDAPGGTTVELTATASIGARFDGWSGCSAAGATCSVTASAAVSQTATAAFSAEPVTLGVGYSGMGSLGSRPPGLSCGGGTCSGVFDYGTTVELDPIPAPGWGFAQFLDASCQNASCRVRLVPAARPLNVLLTAAFSESLVLGFAFEADARDGSRHGHDAAPAIGVTFVPGRVRRAAQFGGSAGTPFLVESSPALFGVRELTACAFVRPGSGNAARQVLVQKAGSYSLSLDGSGAGPRTVHFEVIAATALSGSTTLSVSGTFAFPQDWNHVCGRYRAGLASAEVVWLFLDGRRVASDGGLVVNELRGDTSPLSLGGCGGCTTANFDGTLDEARIWGRALDDAEITAESMRR